MNIKGMVQVDGYSYRITKIKNHHYHAYRILDDAFVGSFKMVLEPGDLFKLDLQPQFQYIDAEQLRKIATHSIKFAKVSWVGKLVRKLTPTGISAQKLP